MPVASYGATQTRAGSRTRSPTTHRANRSYTDPRRFTHTFAYDAQGRLVSDANPAGGQKALTRVDEGRGYTVSLTSAFDAGTTQLWTYKVDNLATGDQLRTDTRPDGTAT